ncbi:MAG TPA: hypothetical protein VHW23_30485, partial [Kofleriaceae bacterium]|nr:hypothetical protein [Kofleriaceae bacterium]
MTADPEALGALDAVQALDADPDAADQVAAWLRALDRRQREALRPQLQRIAAAVQTVTRLLDELRARDAADDAAPPAGALPWFELLARGLAAGEVTQLGALAGGPDVAPQAAAVIEAGIAAWLDESRPTRDGELLHFWAELRVAPGWPSAADAAAQGHEAPLIAGAHEARLYAVAGLDWLADDATARVERLGPRTRWAQLARAVRDLDRDELDDAESGYQSAAMRWPSSPESYAGLAAIAESRGFWTDAYGYYEHLAGLCADAPDPLARVRAALFWVRSTRRASPDATGALLALASHRALPDDRALRRRILELAIAGDCPLDAPWQVDARVALAELLAQAGDPAAGPAFAEVAAAYRAARDYPRAAQFSRRAIDAGKRDAAAYWTLADDLRLGDPSDPRRIDEAIALWQQGVAVEPPGWATEWALLARAMLGDAYRGAHREGELAATLWFGEWVVAIASDSALNWSFLARFYRSLNAEVTALALVRRALELDPTSTAARDELAVTLTSLGRWREALDVLDGLEAAVRTAAERRWIGSLQGYLLAGLGDDPAALDRLRPGCEPWAVPVAAQLMRRLGDAAGAERRCREVWDDVTQPALLRAVVAFWLGQAAAGEALLAQMPPELTDDPHDVAVARAWLRAGQGDWDGAESWFHDAVDAIRTQRQATMLVAELRDAVALLGGGRADSVAAQRGAAWQQRLAER